MTVHLPRQADAAIRAHGRETYNEECCGALIGTEDRTRGEDPERVQVVVMRTHRFPNMKTDGRERRYLIEPLALMRLEDELEGSPHRIVGFYHSHPDHPARPSDFDRDHAWPGLSYLVLAVAKGKDQDLTSWRLTEDRQRFLSEPLLPID